MFSEIYAFHEEVFKGDVYMEWKSGEIFLETKQNNGGRSFPKEEGGSGKPQENGGLKKGEKGRGVKQKGTLQPTNCCFKHVFKKKEDGKREERIKWGVHKRRVVLSTKKKERVATQAGFRKKEWVWSHEEKGF